jgi:general secretion pathway protein D
MSKLNPGAFSMRGGRGGLWSVLVFAVICAGCGGGSSAVFKAGKYAELHQDFDTALVDYQKALQNDPSNPEYMLHEKLVRKEGSLAHLKRGKELLKENRADEAAGEFQKAASMDPSNEAASQELAIILSSQNQAKQAREDQIRKAMQTREDENTSGIKLRPFPPEPIAHLKLSGESKSVYETVGKLANINVAFTQDFQSRRISMDLTGVKIADALRLACLQTKSFYKVITPNTILIVNDTPSNRRDYEDEVVKAVYLSNPLTPADRTAITTALKNVIQLQHIIDNPAANAIIIRDTPERVAAAEQLIHDLDRGKAEIMIDVAVIEADVSRVRNLGLAPVFISSSGSTTQGLNVGLAFNPPSSSTTATTGIPTLQLNQLGHITSADYSVSMPSALAEALLNDNRTRILQNPQIRVTDGDTAKLKIGSRYPYAMGSFLPSYGGLTTGTGTGSTGANSYGLLASTQFQYQDVGVSLDLTPHLLADGDVSLKASIEISSVQAPVTIGGLSEPTFGQKKIEHQIQLKEGETSLLGGLIQSQITKQVQGIPGLNEIPVLRRFFSTESLDREDVEVLVMLTPRVIRLPEPAVDVARATESAPPGQQGPSLEEPPPFTGGEQQIGPPQ